MMFRNQISLFVATFLIVGLFFVALPEKGYSGTDMAIGGCCISEPGCIEFGPEDVVGCLLDTRIIGGECTELGFEGQCVE